MNPPPLRVCVIEFARVDSIVGVVAVGRGAPSAARSGHFLQKLPGYARVRHGKDEKKANNPSLIKAQFIVGRASEGALRITRARAFFSYYFHFVL